MENRCVSCGAIIPEGRQVCPACLAGFTPETFKALEKALEKIGLLIDEFIESLIATFQPINTLEEQLEELQRFIYYTPAKEPPTKTPYFFRIKTRTIFKRLKIYRIRSNCRKESY